MSFRVFLTSANVFYRLFKKTKHNEEKRRIAVNAIPRSVISSLSANHLMPYQEPVSYSFPLWQVSTVPANFPIFSSSLGLFSCPSFVLYLHIDIDGGGRVCFSQGVFYHLFPCRLQNLPRLKSFHPHFRVIVRYLFPSHLFKYCHSFCLAFFDCLTYLATINYKPDYRGCHC